jgi:hypothetical protein
MTTLDHMTDAVVDNGDSKLGALPVSKYLPNSVPSIDYDAHPAYKFPNASLSERIKSLSLFAKSFAFVALRRVLDYENLPLLTKEAGGNRMSWSFAARYISMFVRIRSQRLIGTILGRRQPAVPANTALLTQLSSDGIVCLSLSPPELDEVRKATDVAFAKLESRRASIPLEKRKFDDNVYWCTRTADPDAFTSLELIFARHGILEAASAYLGRPTGLKHVNAQINEAEYAFWKRQFPDTQVPDPWSSYLHIDATYGMLKCAIYTHDIGPDGGPFCYVRGSHHAKVGPFEGMVRRANDFSGMTGRKPDARRMFMALPRWLRKKADFGADLLDSSPDVGPLKEGHFSATSNYGNCILFDGNGIHRGGMVNQGQRRALFILLAEI